MDEATQHFFESQQEKIDPKLQAERERHRAQMLQNASMTQRGQSCEDCHKKDFVMNRAEGTLVCTNCGLVS